MKNINRELVVLRTFAICTVAVITAMLLFAFKTKENQKFGTIDVERINIVESDGTVKMIITNVEQFPNGSATVNGREVTKNRKKRSGMLYFNEDGIECGGFIYDGAKDENGHSSGLSLTYDQYDGDQVMQLRNIDFKKGEERMVSSSLVFNDRTANLTQQEVTKVMEELELIEDKKIRRQKYKEYADQGLIGATPRIVLGKTGSQNNGLFLFGENGETKAMFYVDKGNNVKLEVYDDEGKVTNSWPE
ncbi:hypothetical protein [Christiangramia forsetii]|uniref:Secreted protein n=2 Tax=Christiangramia forsetii TaxID=411153 RepID=A0M702_CHRFK|nr:hypothetical protein [Christiangramia forsetii]GGG29046.1 hypothetical protein GCM10011532_10660 [Christiangramia forsetii]CAL68397.1 secreted protein [Christiangramia forsetii KT0803]